MQVNLIECSRKERILIKGISMKGRKIVVIGKFAVAFPQQARRLMCSLASVPLWIL